MIGKGSDELSARAVFHAEVTRQRELSGWTLAELSDRTRYDASYLQRLEKGDRLGSVDAAGALDRIYGTGDLLKDLWRLAKKEAGQSRYRGFLELEAEATSIQEFSISTVPGLLQSPGYADVLLRTHAPDHDDLVAEQVLTRMNRQSRLTGPKPLNYRGLLDESVLRRPPVGPDVWAEQLKRLIDAAQQPHICLHVVPFRAGLHNLLMSPLQLLWLPSGRTVAYVESSWSGQVIEETEDVEYFRLSYDRLRDSALSPAESLGLLRTLLEENESCATPEQI